MRASSERLWTVLFAVTLFYTCYRYPLQMGDTGTSPTYHATPAAIQIGKYLILAALAGLVFLMDLSRLAKGQGPRILLALFLFGYPLTLQVFDRDQLAQSYGAARPFELFKIGFPFLLTLPISNAVTAESQFVKFAKWMQFACWVTLAADCIEVLLYYTIHRLPNLGYLGAYSVRFGGMWDDPNAIAGLFAFGVPFTAIHVGARLRSGFFAVLIAAGLFWSQALTGSATLMATLVVVGAVYAVTTMEASLGRVAILGTLGLALAVAVGLYCVFSGALDFGDGPLAGWLREKTPSIMARATMYEVMSLATPINYAGFSPLGVFGENGWLNSLVNLGLFYTLLYGVVGLVAVVRLMVLAKQRRGVQRAALMGFASFAIWYLASMFNIPQLQVFPLNVIFAIVVGIGLSLPRRAVAKRPARVALPMAMRVPA